METRGASRSFGAEVPARAAHAGNPSQDANIGGRYPRKPRWKTPRVSDFFSVRRAKSDSLSKIKPSNIARPLIDHAGAVCGRSQYVHPKHPPDKEECDDSPRNVNYPVAKCLRLPKIEHAAMVTGAPQVGRPILVDRVGTGTPSSAPSFFLSHSAPVSRSPRPF